jgi:hypothetical protein
MGKVVLEQSMLCSTERHRACMRDGWASLAM